MCLKDAAVIANSVDPDQTAPLGNFINTCTGTLYIPHKGDLFSEDLCHTAEPYFFLISALYIHVF